VCGAHPDGQDGLHGVRWVWGGSESAGARGRGRSSLSSSGANDRLRLPYTLNPEP